MSFLFTILENNRYQSYFNSKAIFFTIMAWHDARPILSFVLDSVYRITSKVSLEIDASISPLSVPPTDFRSELILPSSLDSRSIVFERPHCCMLHIKLGPSWFWWEMASFILSFLTREVGVVNCDLIYSLGLVKDWK